MNITVVGAGGTGCCAAAELTIMGHQVTLLEEEDICVENITAIREKGGFELTGLSTKGFAEIHRVTNDFRKAIPGAKIIIISALSTRHETLGRKMAPYLENGQVIWFSAGSCGSIILRQIMKSMDVTKDIVVGELEGNLFPCRIRGKAKGFIGIPGGKPKTIAAFPAKDNDGLLKVISEIYPCILAKNVFETTLNASNIIVHLAGSLLNTGSIETTDNYCFYNQGMTPSVMRVIEALGEERDSIAQKLGYKIRSSVGFMRQLADKNTYPQFSAFRGLEGPLSMQDRYIFEDARNGASFIVSLGNNIGHPAPLAQALVTIASVINGEDYYANGRTLDKLGMDGFSATKINKYLQEGQV